MEGKGVSLKLLKQSQLTLAHRAAKPVINDFAKFGIFPNLITGHTLVLESLLKKMQNGQGQLYGPLVMGDFKDKWKPCCAQTKNGLQH